MSIPVLATKLFIPAPPTNIVRRPRLIARLNGGLAAGHRLTLISTPAGFGKTTLVANWLAGARHSAGADHSLDAAPPYRCAWLSLDAADNDPPRFLAHLAAAFETIKPGIGATALAALQPRQPPQVDMILTALLNEITTVAGEMVLVLDDYHVIDAQPVDRALAFLVEHQPPRLHLVIASREDPPLPLARLRARNQLTELRAADLRFTSAESADFLNHLMGLNLSDDDVAALESRTEGWIAGLQLAALSLQGRDDTARFIEAFTGSHRFVLDFLVEEVLLRQPDAVRDFLLQTALLDRFCASLCNALTERKDGRAMLDMLERANLFLVPLDDTRQWYRYHHLFADMLRAYSRESPAAQAPALHRRASAWFERHDLLAEAIRHALAAEDFAHAANLIERVWLAMDLSYQSAAWLSWARALPDELIRNRPVLSVGYAWALLNLGELEASETRLRDAERWLRPAEVASDALVVVDEAEFRALPASISAARAYRALALGDIAGTRQYARQTLALVGDQESIHRIQAIALLGMAEYAAGDLPAAEREFLTFQSLMWQANDIANAIGITFILADIKQVQGRLHEAINLYRQALQLAASRGAPDFLGACDLHRGLAELLCEQGDLAAATQYLHTARQLGEHAALTGWPQRLYVAQARLSEAAGDLAGALAFLAAAERQYVRNPLPERSLAALRTRIWLRQDRLSDALAWAREQNLSPADNLSYAREFEHLTLARVLIARAAAERVDQHREAALGLLARLLAAAEAGGRNGSVLEILLLQALVYQARGDLPRALTVLERALALAEPQGYLRLFVAEGAALHHLLDQLARRHAHPIRDYAAMLLAAFDQPASAPEPTRSHHVPEQLSERELDVLRLLRSELSGPEIARQLIVSLNTLRTHTKSIFSKLGVNSRRAAVRRAEELGLF